MNQKKIQSNKGGRLYSLDVLRGFDMFWIVGGAAFIVSLADSTGAKWLEKLADQMEHVPWAGFHFIDQVFPLFMFISGVVIPFSILAKLKNSVPKRKLILKSLQRMIVLIILGIIYNGTLQSGFSTIRFVSVLGQIGIAYFFAVLIVLYTSSLKKRFFWLAGILLGVAVLQLFVPVPGIGAGVITPEGCMNGYIDRLLLPGRLAYGHNGMLPSDQQGFYDALGILSTMSSIGITLMGTFAGSLLRSNSMSGMQKTGILAGAGTALIVVAIGIHPFYPIIKNCWTSTYTLLAGGISLVLVALFYLLIDVWGWKKGFFFFRVIGMNPLFIYLFYRMVNIWHTSEFLFGWIANYVGEKAGQPVLAIGNIILVWGLLYFLYKKQILIKI